MASLDFEVESSAITHYALVTARNLVLLVSLNRHMHRQHFDYSCRALFQTYNSIIQHMKDANTDKESQTTVSNETT